MYSVEAEPSLLRKSMSSVEAKPWFLKDEHGKEIMETKAAILLRQNAQQQRAPFCRVMLLSKASAEKQDPKLKTKHSVSTKRKYIRGDTIESSQQLFLNNNNIWQQQQQQEQR